MTTTQTPKTSPATDGFDAWCRANDEHVTDSRGVVVEIAQAS